MSQAPVARLLGWCCKDGIGSGGMWWGKGTPDTDLKEVQIPGWWITHIHKMAILKLSPDFQEHDIMQVDEDGLVD